MSDDEVDLSLNCEASVVTEVRETSTLLLFFYDFFLFVSFRSGAIPE